MVIAGGEPLIHRELKQIVEGVIARRKFVTVCTNALLLEKKMHDYKPNPFFNWSVHLDGDREMHDKSVCRAGVYDKAVSAIKVAKAAGFRVTINTTLFNDADPARSAKFFDEVTALGIDGITVSPGYAYERAPDQKHFLNRARTKELFRDIFKRGRGGKAWPFYQSSLFLDFLAGNQIALKGVRTTGPTAPDIPLEGQRPAEYMFARHVETKLAEIKTAEERIPLQAAE